MLISCHQAFGTCSRKTITSCCLFSVSYLRKAAASRVIKHNSLFLPLVSFSWVFLSSISKSVLLWFSLLLLSLLSFHRLSVSLFTLSSLALPFLGSLRLIYQTNIVLLCQTGFSSSSIVLFIHIRRFCRLPM